MEARHRHRLPQLGYAASIRAVVASIVLAALAGGTSDARADDISVGLASTSPGGTGPVLALTWAPRSMPVANLGIRALMLTNGTVVQSYSGLSYEHVTGAGIVGASIGKFLDDDDDPWAAEVRIGVRITLSPTLRSIVSVTALVPFADPPVPVIAFTAGVAR